MEEEPKNGSAKELAVVEEEEPMVGPGPAPRVKRKRPLQFEQAYLDSLPCANMYEKSYMHRDVVTHVAVSAADFFITGSIDGHLKFWKKKGVGIEFAKHFRSHLGPIEGLAVSVDGLLCCTISNDDHAVKIYDVVNYDMMAMIRLPYIPGAVEWVYTHADVKAKLAVSDRNSSFVHIYDPRSGSNEPIASKQIHSYPVKVMKYNPVSDTVISGDTKGIIEYWSPATLQFPEDEVDFKLKSDTNLFEIIKCKTTISAIEVSPDGRQFSVTSPDRRIRVFWFETGKLRRVYDESLEETMNLALTLTLTSLLFFTSAIAETFDSNPKFPCQPPHHSSYPFCNISLSTTKRALSLVSLLTLPEKITQLSNTAASVPRLGIPPYEWWSESLHGLADNGPGVSFNGSISSATSFPQVIVSAASFNRTLWREIGSAVAVEGRAMYNGGQAGLTYWAPNINVFRDPRWGRGQETPGEDPKVVSEYGVEFVRGFQEIKKTNVLKSSLGNGDDDDDGDGGKLMLSACCKHFTAYDLEKWGNFTRYDFNAVVTEQDMEDTYQPPFQSCIEDGKASCLMCSYNAVNGVPACARQDLLQKARVDWGFKGYITSDCDAVATIFDYQGYTNSAEEAVADAIKAGVDINCGTYMVRHTQSAIDKGKVSEEQIDRALLNLFAVQLRLGLFDGNPKQGRYAKLGSNDICSSSHRELALEAARQGIVLLKNDHKLLPLKKSHVSSLAIIGPMANNISSMGGTYTGKPCQRKTLFSELLEYVKKTSYASGCSDVACDSPAGFKEAVAIAKGADFVIVVAGLDLTQETEDKDRVSLSLPGKQRDLVTSIAAASKKPVILVLTGGGPVDVTFAKTDPRIGSIVWIGYPGETGGQALAEILFGDFNPGGRLPMTWYPQSFSEVAMSDMHMRADSSRGYPGRTYRFYTGDQVYKFGTGLSYTEFDYEILSAPTRLGLSEVIPQDSSSHKKLLLQKGEGELRYLQLDDLAVNSCESLRFNVRFSVRNTGEIDGSHVLMLYSRMPRVLSGVPERQLIGFERVHVRSSEMVEAEFVIDPCKHLSVANDVGKRVIPLGVHDLVLGDLKHSLSLEF